MDVVLLQAVDVVVVEGKHDRLAVVEMVKPRRCPILWMATFNKRMAWGAAASVQLSDSSK